MSPSSNNAGRNRGPSSLANGADAPLRGVFVHRIGENAADECQAAEFWRTHGLGVDAIEDPRQRFSQLPDLRLSFEGAPWAYCEVKTIAPHTLRVRILHDGEPTEERVEESKKPANERISGDLVTAARQLKAGNPNHSLLNFVFIVNRDAEASPTLLSQLLSESPAPSGNSLKVRRDVRLAEEVQGFRRIVDLCLWVNPGGAGQLDIEACFLLNPNLLSFAEEITGLRRDKLISLDPAA